MYVARFNHAALYREHFPRSDSSFCFYQTCTGDSSVSLPAESLRVYPPSACQSPPLYLFTSIPTFPGNGRVVQQSSLHVTGRGGAGSRLCPVKHCTEIQHVSNKDVLLSKWCRSLYFKTHANIHGARVCCCCLLGKLRTTKRFLPAEWGHLGWSSYFFSLAVDVKFVFVFVRYDVNLWICFSFPPLTFLQQVCVRHDLTLWSCQ